MISSNVLGYNYGTSKNIGLSSFLLDDIITGNAILLYFSQNKTLIVILPDSEKTTQIF